MGFSKIKTFNGFPLHMYLHNPSIKDISLFELLDRFDAPTVDPLYCALVVALVLSYEKRFVNFKFGF